MSPEIAWKPAIREWANRAAKSLKISRFPWVSSLKRVGSTPWWMLPQARHRENKKAIFSYTFTSFLIPCTLGIQSNLSISSTCVLSDVVPQERIPRIIRKVIDCACFWSYIRQFWLFLACVKALLFGRVSRERASEGPRGFAARSRVLARLALLAHIKELARRLGFFPLL